MKRAARDALAARMDRAVREGVFPGGVLRVERGGGGDAVEVAAGRLGRDDASPAVGGATVYDLASLTKVLATSALAMRAVASERLSLEASVADALDRDAGADHWSRRVRVRQLLSHSAGFADWRPYFRMLEEANVPLGGDRARAFVRARIHEEGPIDAPGTVARYSDVGFLLLEEILERAFGTELRSAFLAEVAGPLALGALDYGPKAGAAPTEDCAWRGRVIAGEVGDENAWALGGVAAHAGLFGTASEVARFGVAMLDAWHARRPEPFDTELVRRFTTPVGEPAGSSWALGWDTPTPGASSAGQLVGPRAFGHLGFTGTSLWIDPERDAVVVLLTNRVHPTRDNTAIRAFRPRIHDAIWSSLGPPHLR